ncbi:MAG: glycosyltransferase family 39 protein [Campylobacterales bacterium]|nr:glycosyltransferase family 39 protein [Campylobacterales bacterium]
MNTFKRLQNYLQKHIIVISLLLIIVLGLVLRMKGLTFQSYWLDELFSANASNPSRSFGTMFEMTVKDVHPPLYQSILWIWYHIFGFNELAGRLLSATISSLGIYTMYLLGKEFFNKEVGLIAATIATVNYFLIFYAQEVRSYSLLFLFTALSYMYFFRVLNSYSKKDLMIYILVTVALLNTHFFGFFLVATEVIVFIVYLIKEKSNRIHLIKIASIATVFFIISLLPILQYILSHEAKTSFWIGKPSATFFLDYMRGYVGNNFLYGIFITAIFFSLVYLFKKEEHHKYKMATIILIIWIVFGYLLPYLRSITAVPLLTGRNTIMILPALILLVSYGIYLLKGKLLQITTLLIIVYFSISHLFQIGYYDKPSKQQWREVLFEVSQSKEKIALYGFVGYYQAYSDMLNLNMNILGKNIFDENYNNGTLEECFFVLDAHGDHIAKSEQLKNKAIQKVFEISKIGAKGTLFANNIASQKCLEAFNGIAVNVDFSKLNLTKPYKGNPLGMYWNGTVSTATYELKKGNYDFTVNAKGTPYAKKYAELKIEISYNEKDKKTVIAEKIVETNSEFKDYIIPFQTNTDSNISFSVSFINDGGNPATKEDRNAYLKSLVVKER